MIGSAGAALSIGLATRHDDEKSVASFLVYALPQKEKNKEQQTWNAVQGCLVCGVVPASASQQSVPSQDLDVLARDRRMRPR